MTVDPKAAEVEDVEELIQDAEEALAFWTVMGRGDAPGHKMMVRLVAALKASEKCALETQSSTPRNEWREIESAPRDGARVLGSNGKHEIAIIFWHRGHKGWFDASMPEVDMWRVIPPTHWMLLPAPPAVEDEGTG